jgi:hypothetical protein
MAGAPTINFSEIDRNGSLTLVVGWKSGQNMKLRQLTIGSAVEVAFRAVIASTLADLAGREAAAWSPEADLSPETYLVISKSDLGPSPTLAAEHNNQTLADALLAAENLESLLPAHIPASDLAFYALVVGSVPGHRSAFLRRNNPRRGLKHGRIYTFLSDSLERIQEPIFAFDQFIDLVFFGDQVCILSQAVFAAIFRDQDTLAAQVPAWATDLQQHVPITDDGRDRLTQRALRDSRLRARLESIVRRAHLPTVSQDTIRQAMLDTGMDPEMYIDADGRLTFADTDIPQILYFLNEDLFTGSLTKTGFRADKKATR